MRKELIVESDAIVFLGSCSLDIVSLSLPAINSWLLQLKLFIMEDSAKLSGLCKESSENLL